MNWNKEMSEAYAAGLHGKPCPNDFLACYVQGLHAKKKRFQNTELCAYVIGRGSIIDLVHLDGDLIGRTHINSQTIEELRTQNHEYKNAVLIGFDEACEMVNAVNDSRFARAVVKPSTEKVERKPNHKGKKESK